MINQNRTWKLRWQILALLAAMLIGAATLTDAQERRPVAEIQADIEERRQAIAEMRVDIGKLQAELIETKVAEGIELDEDERIVVFYSVSPKNLNLLMPTLDRLALGLSSQYHFGDVLSIVASRADHDKVREMLAQLEKAQANGSSLPASAPQRVGEVILFQKSFELAPNSPLTVKETVAAIQARLTTPEGHQFSWGSDEARIFNVIGSERFLENVRGVLIQLNQTQAPVIPTQAGTQTEDAPLSPSPIRAEGRGEEAGEMLRQAYERVRILENDLHHYQRLFERGYIMRDQVDVAERELEKARNALAVMRANVDLPIIIAYNMGNNNLEEAYQIVKEHIGNLPDVRLVKHYTQNRLLVFARDAEHAKVMELLESFVANRPGTTASTPPSPALYAPLPVDPDYLALLQRRVEVAKMVLEEARVREGVRTARFAEAELALLEAEFMLKQAQTQRAVDEGTP